MIKDNDFEMKCNCGDYHEEGVWECAIHGKQGSPIDPSPPKYVILPTWNSSGVEMTKESKLNSWSERKRLYDEINRKRKLKKSKNQESLEGSIFNCFLIEQKVKEWRHMIQKAINDPELKRTQLKDVQKKWKN